MFSNVYVFFSVFYHFWLPSRVLAASHEVVHYSLTCPTVGRITEQLAKLLQSESITEWCWEQASCGCSNQRPSTTVWWARGYSCELWESSNRWFLLKNSLQVLKNFLNIVLQCKHFLSSFPLLPRDQTFAVVRWLSQPPESPCPSPSQAFTAINRSYLLSLYAIWCLLLVSPN